MKKASRLLDTLVVQGTYRLVNPRWYDDTSGRMKRCINPIKMRDIMGISISKFSEAVVAQGKEDPPKSPLKRGTLSRFSPLVKGGWGGSSCLKTRPGPAIRQHPSWLLGIAWVFGIVGTLAYTCIPSVAQITPDATLGAEGSVVTPNVNVRGLPADLIQGGATRGINLFHSFSEFNVGNGQRVYFANPAGVENILSRVTGNNLSNILGTLGVDGGANLFLINPNGILFGPNGRLDVGGSFVGTTANAIQFGQQGFFSATNPEAPPLLTVNPSAFFFNQLNAGRIVNNSRATAGTSPTGMPLFGLRVPDGQSLLLVGGDIEMDGGSLNALGGRIELGGLAEAGVIALERTGNTFSLSFPSQIRRSNVTLANDARVMVRGSGGGDIVVNANLFTATNGGRLVAGTEGAGNGGDITVNATQVNLAGVGQSGNGAGFRNAKIENGTDTSNAGNITVNTESFNASSGAAIFNDVLSGVGNGGNIIINTGSLSLTEAEMSATVFGQGDAANIIINARDTVSFNGCIVYSTLEPGAVGSSGNIVINTGTLSLTNGAQLSTSTFGQGNAGSVLIQAQDLVSLSDRGTVIFSDVEAGAVGNGGNINIKAGSFSLTDGAQLLTDLVAASGTLPGGRGNAGNVNIEVRDAVTIAGVNDYGYGYTQISSNVGSGAVGNGGNIDIRAGTLSLTNKAMLFATTFGQGDGANISVQARDWVSLSNSSILSGVFRGAVGKGGNIDIQAGSLSLTDSASLAASNQGGQGNAGSISVRATGSVSFTGYLSGISATVAPGGVGNGGNIDIQADSLSLTDKAIVLAGSSGQGNGGSISVRTTDSVTITNESVVNSSVFDEAVGNGGDITIQAGSLSLTNGSQLSSSTSGRGNAGRVTIEARDNIFLGGRTSNGSSRGILTGVLSGAGAEKSASTLKDSSVSSSDPNLLPKTISPSVQNLV